MAKKLKILFTNKRFVSCVLMIVLAIVIFAGAVYSYGKVSESELKVLETKITYAEGNKLRRSSWIIFETADSARFYCPEDLLDMGSSGDTADWLIEKCKDKTVTISYISRRDLLPLNILRYFDYERMVSLECDGEEILSLATYNRVNQRYLWVWGVISLVPFVIGSYFVISELRED